MRHARTLIAAAVVTTSLAWPAPGRADDRLDGREAGKRTAAPRAASAGLNDAPKTVVTDAATKAMLLGNHMLSLQWVSWDRFGSATVEERDGALHLKGSQEQNGDYVRLDGVVTKVEARQFSFEGEIVTRVSFLNHGDPCTRKGTFTFAATGTRKYWRLQQMDNPCDEATDYVDVYFRR